MCIRDSYNDTVLSAIDSSAFDGAAHSYVIYSDGRVVLDSNADSDDPVYNLLAELRGHSDLSEKKFDALSDVPLDRVRDFVQKFADSLPDSLLTEIQSTGTLTGTAAEQIREAPVSYTHLDVYKRQITEKPALPPSAWKTFE